jgi:hypothetical protein
MVWRSKIPISKIQTERLAAQMPKTEVNYRLKTFFVPFTAVPIFDMRSDRIPNPFTMEVPIDIKGYTAV